MLTPPNNRQFDDTSKKLESQEKPELLWHFFIGRNDCYLLETSDGWRHIKEPLTEELVAEHLAGAKRIATLPLSGLGNTPWVCIDIDAHQKPEVKATLKPPVVALFDWFKAQGVVTLIEDTGGAGYHVWALFLCHVPATKAMALASRALSATSIPGEVEVFPKQARAEFGNGVRLPWGLHRLGHWSHFLNRDFEIDDEGAIEAIKIGRRTTEGDLDKILPLKTVSQKRVKSGVPCRWDEDLPEGRRHLSLFALGCEMRARRLPPDRLLTELQTHNQSRCRPPLEDREVENILQSVLALTKADMEAERFESEAGLIVAMVQEKLQLLHTPSGQAFGAFVEDGQRQLWPLNSGAFKRWLNHQFYREKGRVPYTEALKNALLTLEGRAQFDAPEVELRLRTAWHEGALWYDLGDWRAVRITSEDWEVVKEPPLLFRHYEHMAAQLEPARHGDIRELLHILNLRDAELELLLLVYLEVGLIPDIPQPVLFCHGPHGSGKSLCLALLKSILDPSRAQLHSMPDNAKEFAQVANHHRCLFLDNITAIPQWLADGLSRLATGGAYSKRQLYTDETDIVFENKGLAGVTAINISSSAPDLLDRGLFLKFELIDGESRREEREIIANFRMSLPTILGGLFDAAVRMLKLKSSLVTRSHPRMADFYAWGCAATRALGYPSEDFEVAFQHNIEEQTSQVLEEAVVAPVLLRFMEEKTEWRGTPSDLLTLLNCVASEATQKLKEWPHSAQWLSKRLRRIQPHLSQAGISLIEGKEQGRRVLCVFRKDKKNSVLSSLSSSKGGLGAIGLDDRTIKTAFFQKKEEKEDASGEDIHRRENTVSTVQGGGDVTEDNVPIVQQIGPGVASVDDKDDKILTFSKENTAPGHADWFLPDGTPVSRQLLLDAWHRLGQPALSLTSGEEVVDLGKFLTGGVNLERLAKIVSILGMHDDLGLTGQAMG